MARQTTNDFLFDLNQMESGINGVTLLQARVNHGLYSDQLFQDAGIFFPPHLKTAAVPRKVDFLAGRLLIKTAQQMLGVAQDTIVIGENRAPIWPGDQCGAISHSRGWVVCVLSGNTGQTLGVDVEKIASGASLQAIRERVLDAPERALIANTPRPDHLATLAFSAKETLFKALYPNVQRFFGFDAARLSALPGPQTLRLTLLDDLNGDYRAGQIFEIHHRSDPDHVLTWLAVPA
ncbi:MAG: hypothetical protein CSA68_02715 [Rhodobacterales bacterium]|nr:MAG: hypothetical protein CSA68_02715 [Rhodobacterales bacterium]